MRVCLVSHGALSVFKDTYAEEKADITVFGFEGMGEVSYERELKGETRFFEDAALLSKTCKNVVVCGCVTDTRGHKRKSAVVAENGRLCGMVSLGDIACREDTVMDAADALQEVSSNISDR